MRYLLLFILFFTFSNQVFATTPKVAFLTFDDGPSQHTTKLLQILKSENIPATFFVNLHPQYKDIYLQISKEGHVIGNHTATHNYSKYKSQAALIQDIQKLNVFLGSLNIHPTLFRFPGGSNNPAGNKNTMSSHAKKIQSMGMTYWDWDVDSLDSRKTKYTPEQLANHVLQQVKNKPFPVILFHDTKSSSIQAAKIVIQKLKKMGYQFDTLDHAGNAIQFLNRKYKVNELKKPKMTQVCVKIHWNSFQLCGGAVKI